MEEKIIYYYEKKWKTITATISRDKDGYAYNICGPLGAQEVTAIHKSLFSIYGPGHTPQLNIR